VSNPTASTFRCAAHSAYECVVTLMCENAAPVERQDEVPFFIILEVAVGGPSRGDPDHSTVFPQEMVVDYVRACER
jgi:hypothetical protein